MDKVRYFTPKSIMARSAALLLLVSFCSAPLSAESDGAELAQPVLREQPGSGGQELPIVYLESAADALYQVALDAGVVLCLEDGVTDPAFEETCLANVGTRKEIYRLRWNADLQVANPHESRQVVIITLSLDVYHALKRRKKARSAPSPKHVIQQVEIFTPADLSAARREELIGGAIYDTIVRNDSIRDWFDDLQTFEQLLLPRPPGFFPPPPVSRYAEIEPVAEPEPMPPEIEPAQLERWEAEKERIVDLLIADQALEARESAVALLQEEGLPEDLAQRVRELHDTAVEKVALETATETETTASTVPAEQPKPLDVMFEVRFAPAGSGFRSGIDGKLYISYREIRFVPGDSEQGSGWSVKWPALEGFGSADGEWDVAHPLFIETKDGAEYFIAERMKNGRYGKGEQILEYIDRGRRSMKGGNGV